MPKICTYVNKSKKFTSRKKEQNYKLGFLILYYRGRERGKKGNERKKKEKRREREKRGRGETDFLSIKSQLYDTE